MTRDQIVPGSVFKQDCLVAGTNARREVLFVLAVIADPTTAITKCLVYSYELDKLWNAHETDHTLTQATMGWVIRDYITLECFNPEMRRHWKVEALYVPKEKDDEV